MKMYIDEKVRRRERNNKEIKKNTTYRQENLLVFMY